MIDIKSDGPRVYRELQRRLPAYKDMLSHLEDGKYIERAVQIVISGDRPEALMAADPRRYAGIDGRIKDLDSDRPAHLMPMISDRWGSHFTWRGRGEIPAEQRQRLQACVSKAHQRGRRIRFWATPESPAMWRVLLEVGVDHINTDKLEQLSQFLRESPAGPAAR
jgi:hypothetical protein